jgi:hypothetical protein
VSCEANAPRALSAYAVILVGRLVDWRGRERRWIIVTSKKIKMGNLVFCFVMSITFVSWLVGWGGREVDWVDWYAMAIAKRDQKHVLLDLVVFCFFLGEWSLGTYSYTCRWM